MTWNVGWNILPYLVDGNSCEVAAVSPDGGVVVGYATDSSLQPIATYWTPETGPVTLGLLSGGTYSFAQGVSTNGAVIVGTANNGAGVPRAVMWTLADGLVDLAPPEDTNEYAAYAVSADGTTIVGSCDTTSQWFIWTTGTGIVTYEPILDTTPHPFAASDDGTVVAVDCDGTICRWTTETGLVALGDVVSSYLLSQSMLTADGSGIASAGSDGNLQVVSYFPSYQITDLGGPDASGGTAVGDGTAVTGSLSPSGDALIWTSSGGFTSLSPSDVLGAESLQIVDISRDKTVFGGSAGGIIPPIPPPSYTQIPIDFHSAGTIYTGSQAMYVGLTSGVLSFWLHAGLDNAARAFDCEIGADYDGSFNARTLIECSTNYPSTGEIQFHVFRDLIFTQPDLLVATATIPDGWPAQCCVNVLISFDFPNQRIQIYLNDTDITPVSPSWPSGGFTPPMGTEQVVLEGFFVRGLVADLWWGQTPSFVDLTVESNRRKFIASDLSPVYLGANGEMPFGTSPATYQTMPTTSSDWLVNSGSGAAFTNPESVLLNYAGDPCTPVARAYAAVYYSLVTTVVQQPVMMLSI